MSSQVILFSTNKVDERIQQFISNAVTSVNIFHYSIEQSTNGFCVTSLLGGFCVNFLQCDTIN
jgi:hypothetical protein